MTTYTRSDSRIAPPRPRPEPAPNVPIRATDHELEVWSQGQRFAGRDVALSRMAGAQQVHVNLNVVPPGKQSCPFHYHMREEEHFYVLSGRCVLRSGDDRHVMEPGDYVCFPAGTGVAHAFENPYDKDCTLLAIGPSDPFEIAVYPDSGKAKLRAARTIVPWPQETLDYWHGEPADAPVPAPEHEPHDDPGAG
jgi:uncharacterized cupin superfamily protein